jgi:DNA-directed RNA polymerase specialized sigma24 family protein
MCVPSGISMTGQTGQNGALRVSPMDRHGRLISPPVLRAAEEVSRRAILHAERLFFDPAIAANLLEEAAATVSRALKVKDANEDSVRDLESYLFRAFIRRLNRAKKQQSFLAKAVELQPFLPRVSWDPRKTLEMKIFIDEFLTHCDPAIRDVFYRRMEGYSWREVGQVYRISSHAAESKFSQALQKVRSKLRLK